MAFRNDIARNEQSERRGNPQKPIFFYVYFIIITTIEPLIDKYLLAHFTYLLGQSTYCKNIYDWNYKVKGETVNGERGTGNGKRGMENGKWKMEN